jgi:hypothetical protein
MNKPRRDIEERIVLVVVVVVWIEGIERIYICGALYTHRVDTGHRP